MKSYKTIYINGEQKRLHRYLMENKLGRKLSVNEIVHHKNGDIYDNRLDNLEIVSRSKHKKLHPEIGKGTRFKKIYSFDLEEIFKLYLKFSYKEIAEIFGCSSGTIQRIVKENNFRKKIECKICKKYATYRKEQLCSKHYHKIWRGKKLRN